MPKKKNQRQRKRAKKIRKTRKLYILSIKNKNRVVLRVISHYDYNHLMLEGMELASDLGSYWEIIDSSGKFIDGTFNKERRGHAIRRSVGKNKVI